MEMLQLKKDQVYHKLKKDILSGELSSGKKLLSEPELAKKLSVGRVTLRASLGRLEDEGYITRINGKGTFVSPEPENHVSDGMIMIVHAAESGIESVWHYIVPGIVKNAEERNLDAFTTTNTAFEMFSDFEIKTFVQKNKVIGIVAVMCNFTGNELILPKLRVAKVPVVITNSRAGDSEITGFAGIGMDEKNGWEVAIAYLAESGHKNIGIIGNTSKSGFRSHSKQEILDCLSRNHAIPDERLIKISPFDKEMVKAKVNELFDSLPHPTAILCYSDFYAIYVYEALKEMNLRIPEDVAVMGTCGYPDARLLSPPLSTIDYRYTKMAETAVTMLQTTKEWFDPVTGLGMLRIQPFQIRKRQSTECTKIKIKQ